MKNTKRKSKTYRIGLTLQISIPPEFQNPDNARTYAKAKLRRYLPRNVLRISKIMYVHPEYSKVNPWGITNVKTKKNKPTKKKVGKM